MRPLAILIAFGSIGFAIARLSGPSIRSNQHDANKRVQADGKNRSDDKISTTGIAATQAPHNTGDAADVSVGDRLTKALGSKNPFECASRVLAVIDEMDANAFRMLAASPKEIPAAFFRGFDHELDRGFKDALVERWIAVDPAGALAGLRQIEVELKTGAGTLTAALARIKPEMLLDALPEHASWDRSDTSIVGAFNCLARRNAQSARGYLDRISDPELRKSAELAIAEGVAAVDPIKAVSLARQLDSASVFQSAVAAATRIGPGMLRQVLEMNDGKFPHELNFFELAFRYPNEIGGFTTGEKQPFNSGITSELLRESKRLTPEERAAILGAAEHSPADMREKVTETLTYGWARQEPRNATEWAFTHAIPSDVSKPETQRVGAAFYHWMRRNQEEAIDWWSKLPESPLRVMLGNGLASHLAMQGKVEQAMALYQPQQNFDLDYVTHAISYACAQSDPIAAAQWIDSLPDSIDIGKSAEPILEKWITQDAAAAARWVEAQPAGARRDRLFHAYSRAAAELDPGAAAEWVINITNSQERFRAAEFVFRAMDARNPSEARNWLRTVPGAETGWLERIIRY